MLNGVFKCYSGQFTFFEANFNTWKQCPALKKVPFCYTSQYQKNCRINECNNLTKFLILNWTHFFRKPGATSTYSKYVRHNCGNKGETEITYKQKI